MLTTERLFIEKFTPEEIPELMKIEHAPDNCKFTWTNTKEEHEEELNDPKVLTLAVKRREDGYIAVSYTHLERQFWLLPMMRS